MPSTQTGDATFDAMPTVAIATVGGSGSVFTTGTGKSSRSADATFVAMAAPTITATGAAGGTPAVGSRRNAIGAMVGTSAVSFTANDGRVRLLPVGSGVVTVAARNRRSASGGITGAASTSFTAKGQAANAKRAILQPVGAAGVFFGVQLRDVTPPVITNLRHVGVSPFSAVVQWETDEPARGVLSWGFVSGTLNNFVNEGATDYKTQHSLTIPGLQQTTLIYYRVTAVDIRGNSATSGIQSFTTLLAPPKHRFFVDWSGDGEFLDSQEEVTNDLLFMEPVTGTRGRDQIRQLAPPSAGSYESTLDNRSLKYSPSNVNSPLMGLLEPGRLVRWIVQYGNLPYLTAITGDFYTHLWRMGETSGTVAANGGGGNSARTGTYHGNYALGQDGVDANGDPSVSLGGGDSWIEVADHASLRPTPPFAVEVWLSTTTQIGDTAIFRKDTLTSDPLTRTLWGLELNRSGQLGKVSAQYYTGSTGVSYNIDSGKRVNDGAWHHIAMSIVGFGPYTMELFVDGESQGTLSLPTFVAPTGPIGMGANPPQGTGSVATNFAPMRLDEVAMYASNPGAARWLAHYQRGMAGIYYLFTGVLDDLPQKPIPGRETVKIPALGTLSRLRGNRISTGVYQNISVHTAMGILLDEAGWPANDRQISISSTVLDWWWLEQEDAFSAMVALLSMEGPGAAVYEDGRGWFVFEGRTFRLLQPRATQLQAVFSDAGPEPWRSPELGYEPGLKDIVNACSVRVDTRTLGTLGTIWQLGSPITLGNGETKGYTIRPSDPFQDAVTPVAGTDYTVTAGSVASVTMTRTNGNSTAVFVTAGAGGATLSGLQLRAKLITVTNTVTVEEDKTNPTTILSRQKRGIRSYPLPLRHEMNPEVARDFCNVVVQRYRDPRPQVTITVPCVTETTTRAALARQVSDRIAIQDSRTGISMPAHIEQIRWEWRQGDLYAIFGCEQASTDNYAVWGTATWDTSLWAF